MSVLAGTVYERRAVLNNSRIARKLWATPDVMDMVWDDETPTKQDGQSSYTLPSSALTDMTD